MERNLNPFGMRLSVLADVAQEYLGVEGKPAAEERHRAGKRKNADGSRENADRKAVFKRKRKKEWTGRTE